MARIGCLDRFLHTVSRGRWKPNNTGKLLRESGYCMGYPRFGAILALFLARLCLGTPFCWRATEACNDRAWTERFPRPTVKDPGEFDRLPMWAHFLPTALAQFHTIFAMMVVMNGAVFLLGLCDPDEIAEPRGLIWWPVTNELCS
eukprot:Skav235985  [mRNA]  locus=scaffold592:480640:487475:- [translate_table: standard]